MNAETWPYLRAELELAEELAKQEGFRAPRLDETLPEYQAALKKHVEHLFAEED